MKAVVISRHALLQAQERALAELGAEVVEVAAQYDPDTDNPRWQAQGVEAVFTIALPPTLLARLCEAFRVFTFEMASAGLTDSEDAARAWCAESPDTRSYLPAREGSHRLLEFRRVLELRIAIETTPVWEA
ncbi:MAG: hypothetical protein WHS44_06570 [Fimbriimonadales bacterium]|nr:MAG: hypothetical protein KatS3mg018_1083 [Fimbriimonadales bacterium]